MAKLRVGVLGCGKISEIYLKNLTGPFADDVEVVAVADVVPEAAESRGEEFGVGVAASPDALLADDGIQLVLNLTPAPAHAEVNRRILASGKHLYSEKPLALSLDDGRELVAMAAKRGLRLAAAPDTILGAGTQTARRALDDGAIGEALVGRALIMLSARHEPYYTVFRGPVLDLGPYHVAALISLLGPVRAVTAVTREATFLSPDSPGRLADAPATAAAVLAFDGGTLVTLAVTSACSRYGLELELIGDRGRLVCPDPNNFGGDVTAAEAYDAPAVVETRHAHAVNSRGLGVADLALAIAAGRPHRLSPALALHTLDVLLGIITASREGRRIDMTTTCERPTPMPEVKVV